MHGRPSRAGFCKFVIGSVAARLQDSRSRPREDGKAPHPRIGSEEGEGGEHADGPADVDALC